MSNKLIKLKKDFTLNEMLRISEIVDALNDEIELPTLFSAEIDKRLDTLLTREEMTKNLVEQGYAENKINQAIVHYESTRQDSQQTALVKQGLGELAALDPYAVSTPLRIYDEKLNLAKTQDNIAGEKCIGKGVGKGLLQGVPLYFACTLPLAFSSIPPLAFFGLIPGISSIFWRVKKEKAKAEEKFNTEKQKRIDEITLAIDGLEDRLQIYQLQQIDSPVIFNSFDLGVSIGYVTAVNDDKAWIKRHYITKNEKQETTIFQKLAVPLKDVICALQVGRSSSLTTEELRNSEDNLPLYVHPSEEVGFLGKSSEETFKLYVNLGTTLVEKYKYQDLIEERIKVFPLVPAYIE